MDIGERIKLRRKELKLSADVVAEKLGVSRSTIFRYEKGDIEKLPTNILDKIAEILKTSPAFLMGWEDEKNSSIEAIYNQLDEHRKSKVYRYAEKQLAEQNKIVKFPNQYDVDIYGSITAGHGSINFDKEHPTKTVKLDYVPSDYDIAFEVSGDSMHPTFQDGEIIFVKKTNSIHDGMLAAVEINDEAFIKKLYIEENRLRLVSLNCEKDIHGNRLYPDFYADEKDDIHLIGRVLT